MMMGVGGGAVKQVCPRREERRLVDLGEEV